MSAASPTPSRSRVRSPKPPARDLARRLSGVAIALLLVLAVLYAVLAERSYAGRSATRAPRRTAASRSLLVPAFLAPARREIVRERRAARAPVQPATPPPPPPAAPQPNDGGSALDSAGATSVS